MCDPVLPDLKITNPEDSKMIKRRDMIKALGIGLGAGAIAAGPLGSRIALAQSARSLKFQLLGFTLSIHVPSYAAVHDLVPSMGYGPSKVDRIKQIRIATQNMVAGAAELGETDPPTVLRAAEAGADLKIIGHFYNNTTLVLVANADKVKSAEDLAKPGIRIAIAAKGDVTHVLLVGPMQKRGLDPEKLTFVEIPGSGTRSRRRSTSATASSCSRRAPRESTGSSRCRSTARVPMRSRPAPNFWRPAARSGRC